VAGRIARLLAFFRRAEPRRAAPSGWALAVDAAVAVGAAISAVAELSAGSLGSKSVVIPGVLTQPVVVHPGLGLLAAAAMTALPLALRRLYPVSVWLAVAAAIIVVHPFVPRVALGTAMYAAYSAVAYSRYRNFAIAAVSGVAVWVAAAIGNQLPRFPGVDVVIAGRHVLTAILAIGTITAAGLATRKMRSRLADSAARLDRAAAEARAATEAALAAERSRIASDLHDVVTHNVSVMIVQAGAARKILASSPADAEEALLEVESTGREAMAELRNLLGLLSPSASDVDGDSSASTPAGLMSAPAGTQGGNTAVGGTSQRHAARRPQPGLGELDALISRVSAAGLPVKLTVTGEPRPLPPGPDLAAYRVVQEGLTNVLRHAGRTAASVAVQWGELLVITVTDSGDSVQPGAMRASSPPAELPRVDSARTDATQVGGSAIAATAGRGLLGLRERLALYGGELASGPLPGGGWQVRAAMPPGTGSPT
jgi:signal transduction histidine kinase